jgi:hypothetical protein
MIRIEIKENGKVIRAAEAATEDEAFKMLGVERSKITLPTLPTQPWIIPTSWYPNTPWITYSTTNTTLSKNEGDEDDDPPDLCPC